jgi:PhnB protein
MTDTVKFIPSGYRTATPYLIVNGAAAAIAFYQQSFGARVLMQIAIPKGKIGHAELEIGDSRIMIADEFPELGYRGPIALGGTPVSIVLYVEDCDSVIRRAIGNGAMALKPVADQFYGDRSGTIQDPFGHVWTIATHKEDLSAEELNRRSAAAFS